MLTNDSEDVNNEVGNISETVTLPFFHNSEISTPIRIGKNHEFPRDVTASYKVPDVSSHLHNKNWRLAMNTPSSTDYHPDRI